MTPDLITPEPMMLDWISYGLLLGFSFPVMTLVPICVVWLVVARAMRASC
ncbi:MAG: hypothetical protein ACRC46_13365 [Thermoguttaceae bacterium]